VADAVLRERPLAVCLIFLGGLADIGQLIDFSIGELILAEVMRKLPASDARPDGVTWYVGQLGESVLGAVIRGDVDRDAIRGIAGLLCAAIAHPIDLRDATFRLAPAVGVAVLGQDASQPAALLDHARSAMLESRRAGAGAVQFYSDTLHMLPVARLDIARELRAAIGEGQIGLRYAARHDLSNGRIAAIQSYMHWEHPLQGEVPAAQFIPIADATGLAVAISRAALERLAHDLDALTARFGRDVPVSFGALRQHVTSGHLLRDCSRLLPSGETKCGRFQLRISERSMATLSRPERVLGELTECGHRVVIDEMGRGLSSLARLPQWPVWALQIDRALVKAAGRNAAALRSCRGITALAHALEVATIAAGIDDESTRARMLGIGCLEGLGDHYPAVAPLARVPAEARATR
jgi:predicted signal transduction protein with EAL and GGDEF domain